MTTFTIKQKWIETNAEGESGATLARLQIYIGKHNLTEHKTGGSKPDHALEIPTYFLAEWIAENWWVLLHEPRKDDEANDTDYLARHSIVSAQAGFPLPGLTIVPLGRGLHLNCAPRNAPFARARFLSEAFADVDRPAMEKELSAFVDEVVHRLKIRGLSETPVARIWSVFTSLTPDQKTLCMLLGSLGTSPADASDQLVSATERMLDVLGERATRDFCLAADAGTLQAFSPYLDAVATALEKAPEAALDPLLKVALPADNFAAPSWRRGKAAADRVRSNLGIGVQNANAADILFERMSMDPGVRTTLANSGEEPFVGAVARSNGKVNVALLQDDLAKRRFSAARAAYLAWVSEAQSRRLVTNAVTRDQQASRSFAAEILIPQAHLLSLAGPKKTLHMEQLHEAAQSRKVMPDVAIKQATNANIKILRH
jgi:hypothetical protein